jgi:arylformamidase
MSRLWDLSLPISPDMLTWPGDPPVRIEPAHRIASGDAANVSEIHMGTHTGTHVDPPHHFIDGAPTVESLPLDVLMGDAVVVEIGKPTGTIGPEELEAAGLAEGDTRVLFKTPNSAIWAEPHPEFPAEYVSVGPEGATWLVQHGIRLVGVDFLSVEKRGAPGHPTHVTLLGAGVVVIEGLNMSGVEPGRYQLICLPIKILGGDGAPARAVLLEV